MRIAVLTTQTTHHTHFVRALTERYEDVTVFCETATACHAPFDTHHTFEEERDQYERERWFDGTLPRIEDFSEKRTFGTMNAAGAVAALRSAAPELIIVFGTGILKPDVISVSPTRILNLHGGDPERYRGLDTHLWAIFHRDFSGLVTTLHRVDVGVDTGDIVLQSEVPVAPGVPFHGLRAANTEVCVRLATAAIDMVARHQDVVSRPQRTKGRYYSAMPAVLKDVCIKRFDEHFRGEET